MGSHAPCEDLEALILHRNVTKASGRRRARCSCLPCELCQQPASIFCPWDDASLCDLCDAKVHSANFLVARHSRHVLCPCCGQPDLHSPQKGPSIEFRCLQVPCAPCAYRQSNARQQEVDLSALSSAESCCIDADVDQLDRISSATSPTPPCKRRRSSSQSRRPSSSSSLASSSSHAISIITPSLSSQEEGLGDSEEGSYVALRLLQTSPPRRRRRLLG